MKWSTSALYTSVQCWILFLRGGEKPWRSFKWGKLNNTLQNNSGSRFFHWKYIGAKRTCTAQGVLRNVLNRAKFLQGNFIEISYFILNTSANFECHNLAFWYKVFLKSSNYTNALRGCRVFAVWHTVCPSSFSSPTLDPAFLLAEDCSQYFALIL